MVTLAMNGTRDTMPMAKYKRLPRGCMARRLEEHTQGVESNIESRVPVETQQQRKIFPAGTLLRRGSGSGGAMGLSPVSCLLSPVYCLLSTSIKGDRAGLMSRTPAETSLVCHVR
jgi:hypothetical protein